MKHVFPRYKIQLVKENSSRYECENEIISTEVLERVTRNVLELDKECEEVFCIIALNVKNKVLGTFEVSRGIIDSSLVHPREIFKRLFLLNAPRFIAVHNHPSGCVDPSNTDIITAKRLMECSEIMDIKMLDFAIIGNHFCSFKEKGII